MTRLTLVTDRTPSTPMLAAGTYEAPFRAPDGAPVLVTVDAEGRRTHESTPASKVEQRGIYRAGSSQEGWRTFYAINTAGYVALRVEAPTGRGIDPKAVREWMRQQLDVLDPIAPVPSRPTLTVLRGGKP